ncbi:MAG: tetratricopeptide repeat protein, partial [Acidobacteriota bacterium]
MSLSGFQQLIYRSSLSLLLSTLLLYWPMIMVRAQESSQQDNVSKPGKERNEKVVGTLETGKPIEQQIVGNTVHQYEIKLMSGQFLHIVVKQLGIDVVVTLYDQNGKKLIEANHPNSTQRPETVFLITETGGNYRLEVRSFRNDVLGGRYEVRIEELRQVRDRDRELIAKTIAARKISAEVGELRSQQTAESLKKAIEKLNELVLLWRDLGNGVEEADELNRIGLIYELTGERQRALEYFNQALSLFQSAHDRYGEAAALNNAALVYDSLGERQKALDYYEMALKLLHELGDRSGEGNTLNNIGRVNESLGKKKEALDKYNEALPLRRGAGDRGGEIQTLHNIAGIYKSFGDLQKALEIYEQILPLRRVIGNRRGEAATLNNIGDIYSSLGDKLKALDYYNQALSVTQGSGDRVGEANVLHNIGSVHISLGERQKALDYLKEALPIFQTVGDRDGEISALSNIGSVYNLLGDRLKALEYFSRALEIVKATGNRSLEGVMLNNIGSVHISLGVWKKALDYCNRALSLRQEVGEPRGKAATLNNIGRAYDLSGEWQKALENFNQALSLFQNVGDRFGEAAALDNIGRIYSLSGDKKMASDYYNRARFLQQTLGDLAGEAITLFDIAQLERDSGELKKALTEVERALGILESLRTEINVQDLRTSYFVSVQNRYEFYIDLLMRLHKQNPSANYSALALQAGERARARTLLEIIKGTRIDFRQGVSNKSLLEQELSLKQQLAVKANKRLTLMIKNETGKLKAINEEIQDLTDRLAEIEAQICKDNPRCQAVKDQESLTLANIQKEALDSDTLLLEYALGKERSYLWLVTSSSIESFELPSREEIEKVALQFYRLLTARERKDFEEDEMLWERVKEADSNYPQVAAKLSNILLGPITNQLGNKRLLIVG